MEKPVADTQTRIHRSYAYDNYDDAQFEMDSYYNITFGDSYGSSCRYTTPQYFDTVANVDARKEGFGFKTIGDLTLMEQILIVFFILIVICCIYVWFSGNELKPLIK